MQIPQQHNRHVIGERMKPGLRFLRVCCAVLRGCECTVAAFGSAVEEDPWRVLDHSRRYLACWFGACGPACAFCARVRPGSRVGVSLRPVEYSPFLVGVEWQRLLPGAPRSFATALRKHGPMSRYRLGVTTCWSAKDVHCTFRCGPEETVMLAGSAGSFSVPADLYSRTVLIQVRSLGSKSSAFKAAFHRRRAASTAAMCFLG
ncbi:uncharacterized protein LOC144180251 [Haemaphysalis longicornis]